jgi:hypothetical protein
VSQCPPLKGKRKYKVPVATMSQLMELDIDERLYERLSKRAKAKGFDSAEEYSKIVLETVLEEIEEVNEGDNDVQSRLEDLGYLE